VEHRLVPRATSCAGRSCFMYFNDLFHSRYAGGSFFSRRSWR
jgi:hypothetical protein